MNNTNSGQNAGRLDSARVRARVAASLKKRHRAERRFRRLGVVALALAVLFVVMLFTSIVSKGVGAFRHAYIVLEIHFDPEIIDPSGTFDEAQIKRADFQSLVRNALHTEFPGVSDQRGRRELNGLVSSGAAYSLRDTVLADPSLIGTTQRLRLIADDEVDQWLKGNLIAEPGQKNSRFSDAKLAWIQDLRERGLLGMRFNRTFFSAGDSREPELAGIRGALMGSLYMLLITFLLSFPLGVATAVYLEEFAPRNKLTDAIEININNLAAVPSIVFGLLGLAIFINFFGLPRSVPLVGALVLTLMTLPTVIIASRSALKSVPPSIREAALGLGASRLQMVLHHVLPLAMPGMLTGGIIGMAQALGETAPLLMIGMVAFIVDVPGGPMSPSTALPVQIFLWADSPERAFLEKTAAAIMVLLGFLLLINALAIFLRKRLERRW